MNSKAWEILNDEERASLSLSINHSKSTWEAGEILNKAHYKYLEIQARAKQFFTMFTKYFEENENELIPTDSEIRWDFRMFIETAILERLKYRQILKKIGKESKLCHKVAYTRSKELGEQMEWLLTQDDRHIELYHLIKEFDRWNNFRILPSPLQEPSAFERRNKTKQVKHLKNLFNLDSFIIDYLKSKHLKPKGKNPRYYLPIVCKNNNDGEYEIIEIIKNPNILNHISKELSMYVFEDLDTADDYGFILDQYLNKHGRTCVIGQKFWPRYRESMKKAVNYDLVNNISKKRGTLKEAFVNLDKLTIARQDKNDSNKNISDAQKRALDNIFW